MLGVGVWGVAFRSSSDVPQDVVTKYIRRLHFNCVEPALCNQAYAGARVPVFIDGMDENLFAYLATHGYTDEWSGDGWYDSQNSEPESSLAGWQHLADFTFVSPKRDSGMMLWTYYGWGLKVDGPRDTSLEVTWSLSDRHGQLVKQLDYDVPITECGAPCQAARKASPVAGRGRPASYPPAYYREPHVLFPYK